MAKRTYWITLLFLWLPWFAWLVIGLMMGRWSMSAKFEQTHLLSRGIAEGVIDVKPYVAAGLEPPSKDPLDIALDRLRINPSAASSMVFVGFLIHTALGVVATFVLWKRVVPSA